MGWDPTRPVPWKRFAREWAIYAAVFALVVLIIKRDDLHWNQFVWIAVSLPIWVGFSGLLAKFGYQRKTLKDIRAETAARAAEQQAAARPTTATSTGRTRPAPTKRTSTGPSNRPNRSRKR